MDQHAFNSISQFALYLSASFHSCYQTPSPIIFANYFHLNHKGVYSGTMLLWETMFQCCVDEQEQEQEQEQRLGLGREQGREQGLGLGLGHRSNQSPRITNSHNSGSSNSNSNHSSSNHSSSNTGGSISSGSGRSSSSARKSPLDVKSVKSSEARAEEALWVLERMRGCPHAPPPSHACWLALTRSLCTAGRIDDGRSSTYPVNTPF